MVTLFYALFLEKHLHCCVSLWGLLLFVSYSRRLAGAATSLNLVTLRFSVAQLFAHLALPACLAKCGQRWW